MAPATTEMKALALTVGAVDVLSLKTRAAAALPATPDVGTCMKQCRTRGFNDRAWCADTCARCSSDCVKYFGESAEENWKYFRNQCAAEYCDRQIFNVGCWNQCEFCSSPLLEPGTDVYCKGGALREIAKKGRHYCRSMCYREIMDLRIGCLENNSRETSDHDDAIACPVAKGCIARYPLWRPRQSPQDTALGSVPKDDEVEYYEPSGVCAERHPGECGLDCR